MIDRATRLRLRRRFRRGRRHFTSVGIQADQKLEKLLLRRLGNFTGIRRFVFSWLCLVLVLGVSLVLNTRDLGSHYLFATPVAGGTHSEGILGRFTNANPMYAISSVDVSVSRLVFSGLFKYNQNNELVPDLAAAWQIDETEKIYEVTLRENLKWHDGSPLTAADVAFTFKTIQNPNANSPFFSSWKDVAIKIVDNKTITFTLPNVFAAFPHSLTIGLVPEHLLGDIPASELRSARFNSTNPVGSGPFLLDTIEVRRDNLEERQERIGFSSYDDYHDGKPQVSRIIIRTFNSEQEIEKSYNQREIDAVSGISTVPDSIKNDEASVMYNVPIAGQIGAFFKTSSDVLKDKKVRQGLVSAINVNEVVKSLNFPAIISRSPLLPIHIGYDDKILQMPNDTKKAEKLLSQAGWKKNGSKAIREKDGKSLTLQLFARNSSEYVAVAQMLQKQWKESGVNIEIVFQDDADLQGTVSSHNYDIVLFGISIGPDPDVFPYWHSSQADIRSSNRLNLSEYSSKEADRSLEAGRTRTEPKIRAPKYKPFLESWREDAPAVMLYQPNFLYIVRGGIDGFSPKYINTAADRYDNVENWKIREKLLPLSREAQ